MSMYNMIFGENSDADKLLAVLGLTKEDFYRYRDAYLSEDGLIAVYTRGGGGNRGCYCRDYWKEDELNANGHHADSVCVKQEKNVEHPLYVRDQDDDFDSTYATFYFRIPADADLVGIAPQISRDTVWLTFLDALRAAATSSQQG